MTFGEAVVFFSLRFWAKRAQRASTAVISFSSFFFRLTFRHFRGGSQQAPRRFFLHFLGHLAMVSLVPSQALGGTGGSA